MALLLAAGMAAGLTGCQKKEEEQSAAQAQTQQAEVKIEGNYYEGEYLPLPEESYLSQVAVNDTAIYYTAYDIDGSKFKLCRYDIAGKTVSTIPMELADGESIDQLSLDSEGNLVALKVNWTEETNGIIPYTIVKMKSDGTVLYEKNINDLMTDLQTPYLYNLEIGPEDSICISNGGEFVWVLDKEGELQFKVPIESGWINGMGVLADGSVAITTWENTGMVIKKLDFDKKAWGETYTNDRFGNDINFTKNMNGEIYLYNASELFSFNPETNETKVVANWLTNDVFGDALSYVSVLEDGRIFLITSEATETSSTTELAYLTKTDAGKAQEKQIITLGTIRLSHGVRRAAIQFNKSSDKYRVEIKEYGGSDAEDGATRFKNEITAGNMPDIVNIVDGTENFYAEKGLLEDLKPYLDGEQGVNRADYFENILAALETDGKLYLLSPDFVIDTLVGKTSDVGEGYNWTMDDMIKLAQSREEGVAVFDHETKQMALQYCLYYNMSQFFDLSKGVCDFDNDEFKKALEFANLFPAANEYADTDPSPALLTSEGRLLLNQASMYDVTEYQMQHHIYGEDISMVGYPSQYNCGSVAKMGEIGLAMNAKSANKEAAWEFIRFFLEEEYQTKYTTAFPMSKAAFEKKMEAAMKKTYGEDENGEQIEIATISVGWQDYMMEVYAATQEEVDAVRDLVNRIDHVKRVDDQIYNIVLEEAEAYFNGQKSVEEVVQVIQSRANIYMNESK